MPLGCKASPRFGGGGGGSVVGCFCSASVSPSALSHPPRLSQEAPVREDGSEREKPVEETAAGGEKEEEEAFLVSLYKFMKDRHTPIERIPHLGFKQSTSLAGTGRSCRRPWRRAPRPPDPRRLLFYFQLTSGRSTKPWRSWEPTSW